MANLETYGDLKKLINTIKLKQKKQKVFSKGKEFAVDQVLGLIPGASNAKTAFDFIEAAISKPDTKKTGTWLDKLAIDDEMSAIVDDTVENGFMQSMVDIIQNEPNNKPLEDDFNMNQKMVDYLKNEYNQRTITGIKENMKTQLLRQLIREEIKTQINPSINTISKDLDDQKSNFKTINTKDKMVELMDNIFNKLDPKFKDSPMFKQSIIAIYNKYK